MGVRPGKSNKEEWVVRRNIRNKNELDKIGDEENPENYNDTENPVVEERITTTADDSENKLENEHYTVLIHEEETEEEKKILNRLLEVMRDQKRGYVCDFKKVDRQKLQQETAKVNRVLKYIKTNNITETNKLIKGVSIVARLVDRKARKIMTMNGALHPKSDIDRLYLGRKNGGRGLISFEYCVRAEENK